MSYCQYDIAIQKCFPNVTGNARAVFLKQLLEDMVSAKYTINICSF